MQGWLIDVPNSFESDCVLPQISKQHLLSSDASNFFTCKQLTRLIYDTDYFVPDVIPQSSECLDFLLTLSTTYLRYPWSATSLPSNTSDDINSVSCQPIQTPLTAITGKMSLVVSSQYALSYALGDDFFNELNGLQKTIEYEFTENNASAIMAIKIPNSKFDDDDFDNIIKQITFSRLVREIIQGYNSNLRITQTAMMALQEASEDYIKDKM